MKPKKFRIFYQDIELLYIFSISPCCDGNDDAKCFEIIQLSKNSDLISEKNVYTNQTNEEEWGRREEIKKIK